MVTVSTIQNPGTINNSTSNKTTFITRRNNILCRGSKKEMNERQQMDHFCLELQNQWQQYPPMKQRQQMDQLSQEKQTSAMSNRHSFPKISICLSNRLRSAKMASTQFRNQRLVFLQRLVPLCKIGLQLELNMSTAL